MNCKTFKYISFFFIWLIIFSEPTHAQGIDLLKPSLNIQMQKNSALFMKNLRIQKENKLKEAALKRKALAQSSIQKLKTKDPQMTKSSGVKDVKKEVQTVLVNSPAQMQSSGKQNEMGVQSIPQVDINKVRDTWLGWYNATRGGLGLGSYVYDSTLDYTAHDWNIVFSKGKGMNHHRRNANDSYYDFPIIDKWFQTRGVNPKVISGVKHVENVGYGYYNCSGTDCTQALINSIRTTYDFFMNEKGKSYDAHYRSIIQPNFKKVGLSIIVEPSENRYYLTMHFITD